MNVHQAAPTELVGDNFQVVPEPGSKKLVVYLTASGAAPRFFNFWKPGNEVKTHRIFVNNKRAWYQQGVPGLGASVEETAESIRKWAAYLKADEIYTVGSSMGGYGAVLFGHFLDARAFAFSWESELNFPGSRSKRLMDADTVVTYPDLKPLVETARKPIFSITGERDAIDTYSLNRLRGLPMFHLKSLRRNLHGPANFLKVQGQLVPMLERFVNNADDIPSFKNEGDIYLRSGFPDLFYKTHLAHSQKDWETVVKLGTEALTLLPTSDQCNLYVGEALNALGRPQDAYPYLSAAIQSGGNSSVFTLPYGNCFRLMGRHAEAIDVHKQTLTKYPEDAKVHYSMGLSFLAMKDRPNAEASFREASRLAPKNETYKKKAERYNGSLLSRLR